MSDASVSEGTVISIGQGDAASVDDAGDAFDAIGEVVSFSDLDAGASGEIDVTHMGSSAKEYLLGLPDNGTMSLEVNAIFGDTGQDSFRTARRDRELRNFRVVLPDAGSTTFKFKGWAMGSPTSGGVDQKVASTLSVRITGPVTES
jgi:hypothetical protein